jgi:PAS domain-containing protein
MRIRDEIRLAVGALLVIQVLTMIAAVALLARMTPAIDQILQDNDKSIRAVERMLLALTEPAPAPGEPDLRRVRFERALAEAANNITEPSEEPVLERIVEHQDAALAGDPQALALLRAELWQLGDINRQSMLDANARAQRLGTAGAWALVFLGLIGVVFSIALLRRARGKLINPVYEIGSVLDACRGGDRHRRYNPAGASTEFREIAEVVNLLVGEHFSARERGWDPGAKLDRVALLRLLDRSTDPTFVCDPSGVIAAANEVALEVLSGPAGAELRKAVARVCAGEAVDELTIEPLGDAGFLVRSRTGAQPDVADAGGSLELGGELPSFAAPAPADSVSSRLSLPDPCGEA